MPKNRTNLTEEQLNGLLNALETDSDEAAAQRILDEIEDPAIADFLLIAQGIDRQTADHLMARKYDAWKSDVKEP